MRLVIATAIAIALLPAAVAVRAAPAPDKLRTDEVGEAFARMDANRDGQLSLQEFEKGIARPFGSQREGVVYQRLPARFRALDVDADGFLGAGEYANLAPRWQGAGEAPEFAAADRNGDAKVDFREFAVIHAPSDAGDGSAAR